MTKTDVAILVVEGALNADIKQVDYIHMDTWFTTTMKKSILAKGLDVFGMVKQSKQRYSYKGKAYTLPELQKFISFDGAGIVFGSLCVATKDGISVKVVFEHNCNRKREWLFLLSTDFSLSGIKIIYIYGNY